MEKFNKKYKNYIDIIYIHIVMEIINRKKKKLDVINNRNDRIGLRYNFHCKSYGLNIHNFKRKLYANKTADNTFCHDTNCIACDINSFKLHIVMYNCRSCYF